MDNGAYRSNIELQNQRRSSSRSAQTIRSSSIDNQSPIQTVSGRSCTQSAVVVRTPSFLAPSNSRKKSRTGSDKSTRSNKSNKSNKSEKSDQSTQSEQPEIKSGQHGKRRMTLTSSFLRRKRIEYAGKYQDTNKIYWKFLVEEKKQQNFCCYTATICRIFLLILFT